MSPLPESTTVLIVGAGPTGLATALSLLHQGFRDLVVVDAAEQDTGATRALVIHAATLEALETFGCSDEIVSLGTKVTKLEMGTRSCVLAYTNFGYLEGYTRYPYVLAIAQNLTEHVLNKKLESFGVPVHRPCRVVGMKRNRENIQLTDVAFEDGGVITAKYVVGADGARSVIRTTAGIGFTDPLSGDRVEKASNLAQMVLADVTFDAPADVIPYGGSLSANNFFLTIRIPSTYNDYLAANGRHTTTDQLYRIGAGVPLEEGEIPHAPTKEYLQSIVDRFGPYIMSSDPSVNPKEPVHVKDVFWSTRFRNHAAIANTPFTRLGASGAENPDGGVIFLVGDAAHIHSPAGGQGMNLGLRDAIFLGEILVKHMRAVDTKSLAEADAILRDFAAERHARALEVIGLTKRMLSVMGTSSEQWVCWWLPISVGAVRNWAMWLLGKVPFAQRKMVLELSGLYRR